jgi:hypothetical protein
LDVFKIGSHELFAQDRLHTMILQISASRVAKITGVTHWFLVMVNFDCQLDWIEKCLGDQ